jgi:hypothetical protein
MRKSRQPRCGAAISKIAVRKTPKLLDTGWNFRRAIFRISSLQSRDRPRRHYAWHEVKQGLPGA